MWCLAPIAIPRQRSHPPNTAGITDGATLMLVASRGAAVAKVQQEGDDATLLPLHEELLRTARRTNRGTAAPAPPTGEFTFGGYQALPVDQMPGVSPPAAQALALLHRLAADPGIVAVMQQHRCATNALLLM